MSGGNGGRNGNGHRHGNGNGNGNGGRSPERVEPIAIIGMRGRFPGASDLDTYWRNLADGVESIEVLSRGRHAGRRRAGSHLPSARLRERVAGARPDR